MIIMENKERLRPNQVAQLFATGLSPGNTIVALLMAVFTKFAQQKFTPSSPAAAIGKVYSFQLRIWRVVGIGKYSNFQLVKSLISTANVPKR
jgi:TRAP-type C4-dicarboxylate transport system permease large subunit